jgi:bacterioferritin (cytochrome b1)
VAKSNQIGMNRTGIDMSPAQAKEMVRGAEELTPLRAGNGHSLASIEREYIEAADPLGSVPLPGTLKGALKSFMDKATGRNPEVFLNKLGERLAFERTGVRLYDALITKCEATGSALPIERLREIRDEEAQHFHLLTEAMESLGADPTAQTPDADVAAVASSGIQKVLTDPRTSVAQCLDAMLTAELTDNAGWDMLCSLAEEMGLDELEAEFRQALAEEDTHLEDVRTWVTESVLSESGTTARRRST